MAVFAAPSPLRLRALSDVTAGRCGFAEEVVMYSDEVARIVLRRTFLELEPAESPEADLLSAEDCGSARCSESTCASADALEAGSWASASDTEAPEPAPAAPPGSFAPAAAASKEAPKRFSMPIWGKRRRGACTRTSVTLKNLPADCTNAVVLELLAGAGLTGQYDFLYVPIDFRNFSAFGYAFVNFVCPEQAHVAIDRLSGTVLAGCTVEATWCAEHQGYAVHVRRYRNSPVMHPSVAEAYKPLIFRDGVQQRFPAPTKKIKEPRLRRAAAEPSGW